MIKLDIKFCHKFCFYIRHKTIFDAYVQFYYSQYSCKSQNDSLKKKRTRAVYNISYTRIINGRVLLAGEITKNSYGTQTATIKARTHNARHQEAPSSSRRRKKQEATEWPGQNSEGLNIKGKNDKIKSNNEGRQKKIAISSLRVTASRQRYIYFGLSSFFFL